MSNLPYFKSSIFIAVEDNNDSEPVDFEIINSEGLVISRAKTYQCDTNPDRFPEIEGFEVTLSIESAYKLRDFLTFSLPNLL